MSDELSSGALRARLIAQTEHALGCGALQPISTEFEFVEQGGIRFLVRVVSNLARKQRAKRQQAKKTTVSGKAFNPFLPYEQDLFVSDLSATHLCLLNKFNVMAHHLLIITRAFELQESELTAADFEAMWACLLEIEGLAFYNAGKVAGASQRHKHLQLVPLPLVPEGSGLPIEAAIAAAEFQGLLGTLPAFPFEHAIVKLNPAWAEQSCATAAQKTLERYHRMLRATGLSCSGAANGTRKLGTYNLLATKEWMLLVPRSQECSKSISVNALGFAGALLVRDQSQLQLLKDLGPMTLLQQVACPSKPNT